MIHMVTIGTLLCYTPYIVWLQYNMVMVGKKRSHEVFDSTGKVSLNVCSNHYFKLHDTRRERIIFGKLENLLVIKIYHRNSFHYKVLFIFIARILVQAGSSINPFIYATTIPRFKKSVSNYLGCFIRNKKTDASLETELNITFLELNKPM